VPFYTKALHTKRSGMDHTVLPAINTMPAFPSWAFTRWHHHNNWGSRHPTAAYYLLPMHWLCWFRHVHVPTGALLETSIAHTTKRYTNALFTLR